MYDVNTILKAMAEGKTADDLAKEFTDALNAANAQIEADRVEAEKLAAAKLAKDKKITEFKAIMADIINFVKRHYGHDLPSEVLEALGNEIEYETAAEVIDEIDDLVKMVPAILALMDNESKSKKNIFGTRIGRHPTIKTMSDADANQIIHDFLKDLF